MFKSVIKAHETLPKMRFPAPKRLCDPPDAGLQAGCCMWRGFAQDPSAAGLQDAAFARAEVHLARAARAY